MARPKKQGMDYFSLDVDFDVNVEALIEVHGNDALAFLIRFWQMAYKTENGEINCSGIIRRTIMNILFKHANSENIDKIITDAIELNLIDGSAYKRGILTSSGIKKRIEGMEQLREKARERRNKNYYSANNREQSRTNMIVRNSSAQSKVKESKVHVQVHTDPEVRTKHKCTGGTGGAVTNICEEKPSEQKTEVKTTESPLPKKEIKKSAVLPLWGTCEFFRMTNHEYELARVWFIKHSLTEKQLQLAIEAVENWLALGNTTTALKARQRPEHHRYLFESWVIEKAQKAELRAKHNVNGNQYRAPYNSAQAKMDLLKKQFEESLIEESENLTIDVTEVAQ